MRMPLLRSRVHVYPLGNDDWEIVALRDYQALWRDLRNSGWRVAMYNAGVLLGLLKPQPDA